MRVFIPNPQRSCIARAAAILVLITAGLFRPSEPASAETVPVPRAAAAYHPDVLDVWVAGVKGGLRVVGEDVEERALAACNKAMGSGCKPMTSWRGPSSILAIVRSNDGGMAYAAGPTRQSAIAAAQDLCEPAFGLACDVLGVFPASTASYSPKLSSARKVFAAGAVAQGAAGNQAIWISSGHATIDRAREAAVAACQSHNGVVCSVVVSVGNGVLQTFTAGSGSYGTMAATSVARAREAIRNMCAERQVGPCTPGQSYTTAGKATFGHEYKTGRRIKVSPMRPVEPARKIGK